MMMHLWRLCIPYVWALLSGYGPFGSLSRMEHARPKELRTQDESRIFISFPGHFHEWGHGLLFLGELRQSPKERDHCQDCLCHGSLLAVYWLVSDNLLGLHNFMCRIKGIVLITAPQLPSFSCYWGIEITWPLFAAGVTLLDARKNLKTNLFLFHLLVGMTIRGAENGHFLWAPQGLQPMAGTDRMHLILCLEACFERHYSEVRCCLPSSSLILFIS